MTGPEKDCSPTGAEYPDATTRRSILMQGVDDNQSRQYLAAYYHCGCWNRKDKWNLCSYHEGFADGVEAANG